MEIKVADTLGQTFDPYACRFGVHLFEFIRINAYGCHC